MEIRDLERSTVNLVPERVFMESETILVQYIISRWSLNLRQEFHLILLIIYVFKKKLLYMISF